MARGHVGVILLSDPELVSASVSVNAKVGAVRSRISLYSRSPGEAGQARRVMAVSPPRMWLLRLYVRRLSLALEAA